jgi:hypothetical protein
MQLTSVQHSFHFISRLSLSKLSNALKVYVSFYISRLLKKPVVWGLPFSLSVEPTTACNLSCPEYISGLKSFTRPTGNIHTGFFKQLVDNMHHKLLYLNFYFQGEPYLHKGLFEMIVYAAVKEFTPVLLQTLIFWTMSGRGRLWKVDWTD